MKKSMVTFCLLFALWAPLQFGAKYLVNLVNCVVEYGSDWGTLTIKTANCAWDKATLQ